MTKEQILDDLNFARSVAEQGINTPLLGGRIGLMWGCLLVPTLLLHGLTLMNIIAMPQEYIGAIWLVFGVSGGILTFILGRSMDKLPGVHSAVNRVEQATWTGSTLMMFGLAIATTFSVLVLGKPYWLFDIIMAAAFGSYIINYYVLAQLTGLKRLYVPMIIAFILMVVIMANIGNPIIYIIAAIGVIFTAVIPAFISLRNEPKNV